MYKIIISSTLLALLTACQSPQKTPDSKRMISSEAYQAQIKAEKKVQAALDLPFRGFSDNKNIQTIAFSSGINNETPKPLWPTIEQNNPELILLSTAATPLKNLYSAPEYRALREKVPFMATWYNYDFNKKEELKTEFLKNWPYVKNMISSNQEGLYHSKMFGIKKKQIQIIMSDLSFSKNSASQISWLESELKKTAALKIIAYETAQREKILNLIKKTKTKNIILIPNDRQLVGVAKNENGNGGGTVFEAITRTDFSNIRNVSSLENSPLVPTPNFGLIKINWLQRVAQIEIRSIGNQKIQSLELKF